MEIPNFENRAERGEENLKEYLKNLSVELKENGIDVDETCHIDFAKYGAIYGDNAIFNTKQKIKELQEKWQKEKGKPAKRSCQEKLTNGEKMEMFKTALFNKAIGKNFFILRSSLYDDFINGIDNVIVEKETGAIVGAFDEVVSKNGKLEKKSKVAAHNTRGGASLKYGIGIENGKIVKRNNTRIPLFYLALGEEELMRAINSFEASEENLSELEKQLMEKLAGSIKNQIESISKIGMLKNQVPDIEKFSKALQESLEPA